MSSADPDDPRDDRTVRDDYIADRVMELSAAVKALTAIVAEAHQQPTHVQKVIHKTEGMGNWAAAAITACFLTYLSMILFGLWSVFQINNLWAWKDVHSAKISVLEAQRSNAK